MRIQHKEICVMPNQGVIAYFMRDEERGAATKIMTTSEATPSFLVGEVDENNLDKLRSTGVVVQVLQPTTVEQGSLPTTSVSVLPQSWKGAMASIEGAAEAPALPAAPGLVDYYCVTLEGPLVESWRQRLQAIGVTLLEVVLGKGYKARLTMEHPH